MVDASAVLTRLIAAAIGFVVRYAWDRFQRARKYRGLGALLAGMDAPTMIVFPPREQVPEAILPRISTEDFLAINNLISAFLRIGRTPPSRLRDPGHFSEQDKKQNNLIIICSSTRNPVTNEVLDLLRRQDSKLADLIPCFEEEPTTRRLRIRWNKGVYPSESFDQTGPEYDDVAVIVKARSPWAGQRKVLVVAGIRGFGTWGAAEFLKKWWHPLYERKGRNRRLGSTKAGDFAALVSVRYSDYDIKNVRLLSVVDLDEASFVHDLAATE